MSKKHFRVFPDLNLLPAVFQKISGIQAVYVFGSAASGRFHEESDLDLAVCIPAILQSALNGSIYWRI